MNKEQFKKNQPIVHRVLSNALKHNRLAHAYLFTGAKGKIKQDTAILFAQSLICSHVDEDGFACQECDSCLRIQKEESYDYKYIHGNIERIKKKDIVDLQDFFSTTSQEVGNKRIYILDGFDQATKDASKSLLKFLEEPSKDIYAILIANDKNNILPTIQSRCQIVTFRPDSVLEVKEQLKQIVDEECAQMLAMTGYSYEEVLELKEKEEFDKVREFSEAYSSHWDSFEEIGIMQMDRMVPKSKYMEKQWIRLWIQWMLYLIRQKNLDVSTYTKIQKILVESLDVLKIPVDTAMLMDQIYNRIRKVVSQ